MNIVECIFYSVSLFTDDSVNNTESPSSISTFITSEKVCCIDIFEARSIV